MNLIKRLRRQFILLATVAVLIIVIGALGLINTLGYAAMRSHVIDTMTAITQNGGTLPQGFMRTIPPLPAGSRFPVPIPRQILLNLLTRHVISPFILIRRTG